MADTRTTTGGLGFEEDCPRCERYLAETPVTNTESGESKLVCRACARTLAEVDGIEAPKLGEIPYGSHGYGGPKATREEIHKFAYLKAYADGDPYLAPLDLVHEFGYTEHGAEGWLVRLANEVEWLDGPGPGGNRRRYRITI